jgi:hypothetical protein
MAHHFHSSEDKYMFDWKKDDVRSTQYMIEIQVNNLSKDYVIQKVEHALHNEKYCKAFIDMENASIVFNERTMDHFLYFTSEEDTRAKIRETDPLAIISVVYNESQNTVSFVTDHCVFDGIHSIQLVCKWFMDTNPDAVDLKTICPERPNFLASTMSSGPYIWDMLNVNRQTTHLIDLKNDEVRFVEHIWDLSDS